MKPETAQRELEQLRKQDWLELHLQELNRLPEGVRLAGRALLGRQDDGETGSLLDWRKLQAAQNRAFARLAGLAVAQREKLFALVFPRLENQIEAAWQLTARLPYQLGYARKSFRVPRHAEFTRPRAAVWLRNLVNEIGGYEQDVIWWAAWAGHHQGYNSGNALGLLFAATIDRGGGIGDEVFEILCASGRNEHEIGRMGRHVARALLTASRPEGWEFMEKMLLAAQRQEGLRQTILECVDEAHPEAFRRMLRLILDHDLARFSAVVRAVDVWFGFAWDSVSTGVINEAIQYTLTHLEDEDARQKAIRSGTGDELYTALWALAFEDAAAAVDVAMPLLHDKKVERRFIAAHLLSQLKLPAARQALLPALVDDDLRVAWKALSAYQGGSFADFADDDTTEGHAPGDLFESLEKLLERVAGKGAALKALVWPWMCQKTDPRVLLNILSASLGDRPPTRLLPHLSRMEAWSRIHLIDKLVAQKKWDNLTRETLFGLVGDTNAAVRERAVKALAECKINSDEAGQMETLLTRKANDLRRGVLSLLLKQPDNAALASADRLLTAGDRLQRLGGLEMLRELAVAKRQAAACQDRAACFRQDRPRLTPEEERAVEAVAESAEEKPTLDNGLGLFDPAERTPPTPPRKRDVQFVSPAAEAILRGLDDLVHEHREQEVIVKIRPVRRVRPGSEDEDDPGGPGNEVEEERQSKPQLLGTFTWGFGHPDGKLTLEEDLTYLPLAKIWTDW